MAPLLPLRCRFCHAEGLSPEALMEHVQGKRHEEKLLRDSPELAKCGMDRLQYYLDAHLEEEPVLGLEYIVEERKDSSGWSYSCQLCGFTSHLRGMLEHLVGKKHALLYIYQHHNAMLPKRRRLSDPDEPPEEAAADSPLPSILTKDLKDIALAIQLKHGRQKIQDHAEVSTPRSKAGGPVTTSRYSEWLKKNQDFYCVFCADSFSLSRFMSHFHGETHRENVERVAPDHLPYLSSLRYLLESHLEDFALVGLEYVLEAWEDSEYCYTCMLCHVEGDFYQMFFHLNGKAHLTRYIARHHPRRLRKPDKRIIKTDFYQALREIACQICDKHGRRDIRVKIMDEC